MSDEWWVMEIEWGVMSYEKKNPNKALVSDQKEEKEKR